MGFSVMSLLDPLFRWFHILFGILWIGMLYFFNFVNAHVAATYDADSKKKVVPQLMPRALFFFRWGAAGTWITGVLLLLMVFYHGGLMFNGEQTWHPGAFVMIALVFVAPFVYDLIYKTIKGQHPLGILVGAVLVIAMTFALIHFGKFSYRSYNIHMGAMFGSIMAFNVWFRIWPAQRQIITAIRDGQAPNADLVALAGLRSKHNTYMSLPLLWTMINAHTVVLGAGSVLWFLGAVAIGWKLVHHMYKGSAKVKGF